MRKLILLFAFLPLAAFSQTCELNDVDISVGQVLGIVIMDTQTPQNAINWYWEIKVTRANGWTRKFNFVTQTNQFQHSILPQWQITQIAAKCFAECLFEDITVFGDPTPITIWN